MSTQIVGQPRCISHGSSLYLPERRQPEVVAGGVEAGRVAAPCYNNTRELMQSVGNVTALRDP